MILRSWWLKFTLLFKKDSSDEEMGTECEVPRVWSRAGFLEDSKEEGGGPSFLGNY